jgi:hypothetical protein
MTESDPSQKSLREKTLIIGRLGETPVTVGGLT